MNTITADQRSALGQAFNRAIVALRLLLVAKLHQKAGQYWADVLRGSLGPEQQANWDRSLADGKQPEHLIDFHHLRGLTLKNKDLFAELGVRANNLPSTFAELTDVRNAWAHHDHIDPVTYDMAMSKLILLMRTLGLTEVEAELQALKSTPAPAEEIVRQEQPSAPNPAELRATQSESERDELEPAFNSVAPTTPQPWFRVVSPHADIRDGHLDEAVFAANLAWVKEGIGADVYRDPETFFAKTYFTAGLKTIAKRVVGGLNGGTDSDNRVLSLQTGFGGGKTHALITLYHLAQLGQRSVDVLPIGALSVLPDFHKANVAVFTNQTLDAASGRTTDEGLRIRTLWGELAYQLGGQNAFDLVRKNDEDRTAPSGLFRKILASTRPALLLIDELADYCLRASSQVVGNSTLADQTISFVQELTEAVSATDGSVLVMTLPASRTEMGDSDRAANILTALQNRMARVGKDTEPVDKDEIFEVLRRRLFEDLGEESTVKLSLDAYQKLFKKLSSELPPHVNRAEYRQRLAKSYPFHPELVDLFRLRWASNHNFQRTRGVLRLLAAIVSDLYQRQTSLPGVNLLIHPSDVNLQNVEALRSKLKELYGNGYDAVMDADVVGTSSNAFKLDGEHAEFRQAALTQGLTATILLGTFGGEGANRGLSVNELKLAFLKPDGFNHNTINTALDKLEDHAHYLYYSTTTGQKRYWFNTKPNVNILINQAKHQIDPAQVDAELLKRLKAKQGIIQGFNVIVAPQADHVPEQTALTLIVLHPRLTATAQRVAGPTRQEIEQLSTKRGTQDRTFRNTLLFLAASEAVTAKLYGVTQEYLACLRIKGEYGAQLDGGQNRELREKSEETEKKVEAALAEAYCLLAKRSAGNDIKTLLIENTKETLEVQVNTVGVQRLRDETWLLDSLGWLALSNNGLEPKPNRPVRVKDVYEAFLRYDDKPLISRPNAVQESLLRFCKDGLLAIGSGDGNEFSTIYYKDDVPYFDVTADTYWLLDKSHYQPPQSVSNQVNEQAPVYEPAQDSLASPTSPSSQPRRYRSVKVKGKLDRLQWPQAFNSFINPFRTHNIEIEVIIKIHSSVADPFADNDQRYNLVKESARQMNLEFGEEE